MIDVVTLAICKEIASSAASGIKTISIDSENNLIFTMNDGGTQSVKLPIKADCVNVKFVNTLPIADISNTTIYSIKTAAVDANGNNIYRNYMYVNNQWEFIAASGEPIATTSTLGLVKPDGNSILISADGTISVSMNFINNAIPKISNTSIDNLFKE